MTDNIMLKTDSYKVNHWAMIPPGTEIVHSYLEAREGSEYDEIVFFGLQYLINEHLAKPVTYDDVSYAKRIIDAHMGPGVFNVDGWNEIVSKYNGFLPVTINSVPEGSIVSPGEPILTVSNNGGESTAWTVGYIESLIVQLWYPMSVATKSRHIKKMIADSLLRTTGSVEGLDFKLHDFGFRGATTAEAGGIGGAAHLVNFLGTDTILGMDVALKHYYADVENVGKSVRATEHSVMTAEGREGEFDVVQRLLDNNPDGILATVIDSYDYTNYIEMIGTRFKEQVLARDGVLTLRPDSVSHIHQTPAEQMVYLQDRLWELFDGTVNSRGFKVLNPKVALLWGDGIDIEGIRDILEASEAAGFATSNFLFGMGGALLQKVNRDTLNIAFKCSAQFRDGEWVDVFKDPLGGTKSSKAGIQYTDRMGCVYVHGVDSNTTPTVYETSFDIVRSNAAIVIDNFFEDGAVGSIVEEEDSELVPV